MSARAILELIYLTNMLLDYLKKNNLQHTSIPKLNITLEYHINHSVKVYTSHLTYWPLFKTAEPELSRRHLPNSPTDKIDNGSALIHLIYCHLTEDKSSPEMIINHFAKISNQPINTKQTSRLFKSLRHLNIFLHMRQVPCYQCRQHWYLWWMYRYEI